MSDVLDSYVLGLLHTPEALTHTFPLSTLNKIGAINHMYTRLLADMAGRVCRPGPARPFSQKPEPNFLGSGTRKSEFSQKPDPGFTRPCLLCYITYSLPDPTDPFFGVPDPNHV